MNEPNHLDDLLAAWAAGLRLQPAELSEMRQAILAEVTESSTYGPTTTPDPGSDARTLPSTTPPVPNTPTTSTGGLPATWWQTFAVQVAGVVVQANRPPALAGMAGGTHS
jgi:hypothetical protein